MINSILSVKNLILVLVGCCNLALGFLIFLKNKRNRINIYYAITAFSTASWTFGLVAFSVVDSLAWALFWCRLYYVSALLIGSSFFCFSLVFPFSEKELSFVFKLLFHALSVFVLIVCVWPGMMVEKIKVWSWGKEAILTPYYVLFVIYFIVCVIGAFLNFFSKFKKANGQKTSRNQIRYIFIGTSIALVWGMTFNLFLPLIGNYRLIWLGPYLSLIMIAFIAYAIAKHHLMNIKVVTVEFLSAIISIFLLTDALISDTTVELLIKLGLFLLVFSSTVLLIRSMLNEVRARVKITKMARILKKKNVELQRLDKAKSEFISVASHQLRTPLSVIKGFLSMTLEGFYGSLPELAADKLKKSLQSNERLIALVDDLLDLSHMEEKRLVLSFKRTSLKDIVAGVYEELRERARDKRLKPVCHLSETDKFMARVDAAKIRQVFFNLFDNAIKYTGSGKVEMGLKRNDGSIIFSVKDTGVGIPEEEKKQLFKKFIRGKKTSRIWTEGRGLGLYVAKLIVEAHHGKIGAKSKGEGRGSEFWVKLPRAKGKKKE